MKFVIKPARRGLLRRNQWRVVVVAGNGETLLTSETYSNLGDAQLMVQRVQLDATTAAVECEGR